MGIQFEIRRVKGFWQVRYAIGPKRGWKDEGTFQTVDEAIARMKKLIELWA